MNYIKQVMGEIRQQPLSIWLSVGGTALSIFLVMAVFIVNDLPSVEARPESCRRSLMVGEGVELKDGEYSSSSTMGLSKWWAEKFYGDRNGVEKVGYFHLFLSDEDASIPGGLNHTVSVRNVDNVFWDIFDFDFIAGKPYSKAESDANIKVAVISDRVARSLFQSTEVVGKEFMLKQIPYRVVGVVKEVNPLFDLAYSEVYVPVDFSAPSGDNWMSEYMGEINVLLLKKKGITDESIKEQVRKRYEAVNTRLRKEGREIVYHETPYSMEVRAIPHGSNTTPDPNDGKTMRWTIYAILLLVPAINLSGMTRSRLRRRVTEVGVRRAFGATRLGVVGQLLGENLIVTLLGGALGLLFCVVFIAFFSNLFVNLTSDWFPTDNLTAATPTFSMIFTWKAFGFAALFCFFLNLVSAGFPVWKAASVNPAEAISGNENFKK